MGSQKGKDKDLVTEFLEESYSEEIEEIEEKSSMSHDDETEEDGESLLTQSDKEQILFNIEQHTNSDGTVDVTIEDFDISESEDQWYEWTNTTPIEVQVHFSFPNGETDVEVMDLPRVSSSTNKFPLLVKSFGYKLSQAEQIKGQEIKYDPESEELVPEIPPKLKLKKYMNTIRVMPKTSLKRLRNTRDDFLHVLMILYACYLLGGALYILNISEWIVPHASAVICSGVVLLLHWMSDHN